MFSACDNGVIRSSKNDPVVPQIQLAAGLRVVAIAISRQAIDRFPVLQAAM